MLLLVVVYLPFCYGLAPSHRRTLFPKLLDRFVGMTTVLAGLAITQFALQLVGWRYDDLFAKLVPSSLLMQGFNTSYAVQYGSSLYKSNAFVCLEASFASQFLAFGLVVSILRGARWWRTAMFVLAILSTVSGTGVILLAVAFVLLAVHKGLRFTLTALAGVGLVVGVLSLTPAASISQPRHRDVVGKLQGRRALRPALHPDLQHHDHRQPRFDTAGHGPGWADRNAAEFFNVTGLPLLYALIPKPP